MKRNIATNDPLSVIGQIFTDEFGTWIVTEFLTLQRAWLVEDVDTGELRSLTTSELAKILFK